VVKDVQQKEKRKPRRIIKISYKSCTGESFRNGTRYVCASDTNGKTVGKKRGEGGTASQSDTRDERGSGSLGVNTPKCKRKARAFDNQVLEGSINPDKPEERKIEVGETEVRKPLKRVNPRPTRQVDVKKICRIR